MKKIFVMYYWFSNWSTIQLGISMDFKPFSIKVFLPFGFIKIGFDYYQDTKPINHSDVCWRLFGISQKWE